MIDQIWEIPTIGSEYQEFLFALQNVAWDGSAPSDKRAKSFANYIDVNEQGDVLVKA